MDGWIAARSGLLVRFPWFIFFFILNSLALFGRSEHFLFCLFLGGCFFPSNCSLQWILPFFCVVDWCFFLCFFWCYGTGILSPSLPLLQ
ncbi:hypothetical protein B9Z19DRAFT_1089262 [Tuber borchii]|uniref:Uncharacterized protein n=1 Tax=Tuber borchii TaxID=42251 RepID=A0A2T6ZKI7_TUBBO|nr:hypothetical protein B9Z19DRAFT_1089262 [Tuber borchii]